MPSRWHASVEICGILYMYLCVVRTCTRFASDRDELLLCRLRYLYELLDKNCVLIHALVNFWSRPYVPEIYTRYLVQSSAGAPTSTRYLAPAGRDTRFYMSG